MISMKQPNGDLNQLLRTAEAGSRFTVNDVRGPSQETAPVVTGSALAPEDEAHLGKLLAIIRSGKRAVIIVDDPDNEKLKYMFSNASRVEAVTMLGRIVEETGRRLSEGDQTA